MTPPSLPALSVNLSLFDPLKENAHVCELCAWGGRGCRKRSWWGEMGCLKKSGETTEIAFSDQLHGVQMRQRTVQDAGAEV